jgi:hypothetical protein
MAPLGSLVFMSPLWTPVISVAVGLEVAWLASSLAFLFWLGRPVRSQAPPRKPPRKNEAEMATPNESWGLAA